MTPFESTIESGSSSRGKRTFLIRWGLPVIEKTPPITEVVHQPRHLELDVVGVRFPQPRRALQAVVEDRQAALVVGIA